MATTVYLTDVAKVQIGWSGDFHDAFALNTFYVFGTGVAGASTAALAAYATAVYGALNVAAFKNALFSGNNIAFVRCFDWSTPAGAEGADNTVTAGLATGSPLSAQNAMLINFAVPLRFRGGHPRMYMPLGMPVDLQTPLAWTTTFVTALQAAVTTFWGVVSSTTIGGIAVTPVLFRTRETISGVLQPPSTVVLGAPTVSSVPATIRRRIRRAGHRK